MNTKIFKALIASTALLFSLQVFAQQDTMLCLGSSDVDQTTPFIVLIQGTQTQFRNFTKDLQEEEGVVVATVLKNIQVLTLQPNWSEMSFPPVLGFDQNKAAEYFIRDLVARVAHRHSVEALIECNLNTVLPQPSVGGAN